MMRTILITGASRGIGNKIALKALEEGHRISIGLREPNSIKGTPLDPKISGEENIHIVKYDANRVDDSEQWIESSLVRYGAIDSIINCAGIFKRTPFLYKEMEKKEIDELIKINLLAPWHLAKVAWPYLIRNQESRLIFLVSMSGKRSKGKLAGYSVSKFALMGLCQTIRNEGWEYGLRVTAICPSWVNTDMSSQVNSIAKEQMTQPEDLAKLTVELLKLPNSCIPFELAVNCNLES